MPPIKSLSENTISELSNSIAYHDGGALSHQGISDIFRSHGIPDAAPGESKEKRLKKSFLAQQAKDGCANNVIAAIRSIADPVRFVRKREAHDVFLAELNKTLIFSSLQIRPDGQLIIVTAAKTLDEAEERSSRLRKKLNDRNVHPDVIACCRTELVRDKNYFHTVFEACKSVTHKIRQKTELQLDGHDLVDAALFVGKDSKYPLLAINKFGTPSERSEQKGFAWLVKGMFSMFRNPVAHEPKIERDVTEDEALEFLVLASLFHRKIDHSHRTRTSI